MKTKSHYSSLLQFVIILLLFGTLNTSCSHKYYAPNEGDLIVLRKKNDVHISRGGQNIFGGGSKNQTFQVGYSPISHLAVAGSYFKINIIDEESTKNGNGHIWNGAIGGYYFFPIKKYLFRKKNKKFLSSKGLLKMQKGILVDLYFGYSDGAVHNFYENGGESHFKFQKIYGQVGLHFIRPNWGIDYVYRIGNLRYYQGAAFGEIDPENRKEIDAIEAKNAYNLGEFSMRVHLGIRHIRYYFSATSVTENSEIIELNIANGIVTFGVILEIDEFFRKKKEDVIPTVKKF